jgi:hypothetical protein
MTFHVYIYDGTVEINEPKDFNSGMSQGTFFRRGILYKDSGNDSGEKLVLQDFIPGNVIHALGRRFHITDADAYTRDYFKYASSLIYLFFLICFSSLLSSVFSFSFIDENITLSCHRLCLDLMVCPKNKQRNMQQGLG